MNCERTARPSEAARSRRFRRDGVAYSCLQDQDREEREENEPGIAARLGAEIDHRIGDGEKNPGGKGFRHAAPQPDGESGADGEGAEQDREPALRKGRCLGTEEIEPHRIENVVVVVVDAPDDAAEGGDPLQEVEGPDLVDPEFAPRALDAEDEPEQHRRKRRGDREGEGPARGGERGGGLAQCGCSRK